MANYKRIAIVAQRYGLEVNGGAEYHARILAEKLSYKYQVDVLTTTALDYHTWENYYDTGEEIINGIKLYRFPTIKQTGKKYRAARRAIFKQKKYFRLLRKIRLFDFFDKHFHITELNSREIENWLITQGPYCPELIKYIKSNLTAYDTFLFFTYLYYPTVIGLPLAANKSIFIPTAHDEEPLYTQPYKQIFSVPKFIMYNTESEKRLIENIFKNYTINCDIAAVGIERYTGEVATLPDCLSVKQYFLYIGRIDEGKGCGELLEYYVKFLLDNPKYKEYKLVLVGKNDMAESYVHPSIIYTGFVPESLKYGLLRSARAMIMPSFYESLSLVTLEAMDEGIPVIVNEKCEVLYDHIRKSGSGSSYNSFDTFTLALIGYIRKSEEEIREEGINAQRYIAEHYTWESVLDKFDKAIDFVIQSNKV